MTNWIKLLNNPIEFNVQTKQLPTKGNLVYEYNPFRNYRLLSNMYEYKNSTYTLGELWDLFKITFSCSMSRKLEDNTYFYKINEQIQDWEYSDDINTIGNWIKDAYKKGNNVDRLNLEKALSDYSDTGNEPKLTWNVDNTTLNPILREKGELVDFITDELTVDLEHPLNIIPLASYDGSVNLIINDGVHIPRLINSRFSATGKNTYEIIDRKGNNDTNIYDLGTLFDIDTSLYKRVISIPKIKFQNVIPGGNLKIGSYYFYFKLSDLDGNETDFVGESGLVSVFIGYEDPSSICTGTKNENSHKQILFSITNVDAAYDYVTVYYSRSTNELNYNSYTEYKKIDKLFPVNINGLSKITITGFEDTIDITLADINLNYNVVNSSSTAAVCLNMLFLANVHKLDIPYKELTDLSLHFLPYLKEERYNVDMDETYNISSTELGYIDPNFIYYKTGYWGRELYRLGIVYILPNGELSPVFNIRGRYNVSTYSENQYSNIPLYSEDKKRNYINFLESNYQVISDTNYPLENVKGVVSLNPLTDTDTIYSFDIRVKADVIEELKKYVKGYFFVRQSRIPLVLTLGITIGVDKESHTPTIPTAKGVLDELKESLNLTYVETDSLEDVNYISEGFLSRYSFYFKRKKSSIFSKIIKGVSIGLGVVALAAATVVTAGAAGAIAAGTAVTLSGALAAGSSTVILGTSIGVATGWATAGVLGAGALAAAGGGIENIVYSGQRNRHKAHLNGRDTKAPKGRVMAESENSRQLVQDFKERIIIKDSSYNDVAGIICPDFEINLPTFNSIFTGSSHVIESAISLSINALNNLSSNYFSNKDRHFYMPSYYDNSILISTECKVLPISDGIQCTGVDDILFRSKAGSLEEAWRYECIADDYKSEQARKNETEDAETVSNKKINSDIVRGYFGPYLGISDTKKVLKPAEIVNIYILGYSPSYMSKYFDIRMHDNSPFKTISDRYDIKNIADNDTNKNNVTNIQSQEYQFNLYRGDCYLCQFTHRVIRNFNCPAAPFNDEILDPNTWKNNYDPNNTEKYADINLGDVNAVQLGMWVTFRLRSSNNLNIRTLDGSHVDEVAMCGHPRGYYPYHPMSVDGSYKISDSTVYNRGFANSLNDRLNFELADVPYIKNWFKTRIMYSDVHVNDAFKNGFRTFQGTNYRDYTREYGEIIKLVPFESSLLCVFEHGVALIPVNERALAGQGSGGNVYINTSNVLPENPRIISDMFGSQWPESVLKVPGKTGDAILYVYGVDTVAKKIWRTDGQVLQCISDFRVLEFLNNNISLGERELSPKIGIRNVKTVYNAFKRDVMFTFYDNTYGFEEKVWNLCWNEILLKFVTFYSWVPSYMENINNIPFSFNRDTSKWIAKLGTSHASNSFADGITLTNTIIGDTPNKTYKYSFEYIDKLGKLCVEEKEVPKDPHFIGVLGLTNRVLPNKDLLYNIHFNLERDSYLNFKLFEIKVINNKLPEKAKYANADYPIYALYYKGDIIDLYSELYYRNKAGHAYADIEVNKIKWNKSNDYFALPIFKDIAGKRPTLPYNELINPDKIIRLLNIKASIQIIDLEGANMSENYYNYKAGFAPGTSLIDAGYYESVVAVIPQWNMQFLTTDFWKHGQAGIMDIADTILPTYWYGKQHPFEFECVVNEHPEIHKIFHNLELIANKAKPESFHYEIVGESYDFAKDKPNIYFRLEAMKALWQYNGADIVYNRDFLTTKLQLLNKSADLIHHYYSRLDTINTIEDYYQSFSDEIHNYNHLSGAEIVHYPNRQEYRIWNHAPAISLDDLDPNNPRSIITANCKYLEDHWKVTINPILICYKNEYDKLKIESGKIIFEDSTWTKSLSGEMLPQLPIFNSPLPEDLKDKETLDFPNKTGNTINDSNALIGLYTDKETMIDTQNWINDIKIGAMSNRRELDLKDKFIKIRIRYSGEELAIINFLNTIYTISYA